VNWMMWFIYRWQWIRKLIGGKWGHVTGFFWGKRWVRLHPEAVLFDENWEREGAWEKL